MSDPIRLRLEPRTAIMARAEVVWEVQPGDWRGAFAKIEDVSLSGACIRLSVPIGVGEKLKIKWRKEQFSGITKYCRRDGGDYVLGVRRETSENEAQNTVLPREAATSLPAASSAKIQEGPAEYDTKVQESPKASLAPAPAPAPIAVTAAPSPMAPEALPKAANESEAANKSAPPSVPSPKHSPEPNASRSNELHAQEPSQRQERTIVFNKLLNRGPERQQQKVQEEISDDTKARVISTSAKASRENHTTTNAKSSGLPSNQGSLLSLQDIYLAVGIMSSRLGYNIDTVSEMADSDHMHGMSNDVKRASILMALEAAGIPVSELLQDGSKRLNALNSYEAAERKRFEDYETKKSQESAQIQAEIEQMTAHCLERIKHNLGEVTLAKDAFLNWQTTKQKEAQRISDAVALFSKSTAVEPPSDSKPALQTVGADSKL